MRRLAVLGTATVLLGFVAILDRGVAGALDLSYLVVTFVGVLAVVVGFGYLTDRRDDRRELKTFDDPERRYRAKTPGDDLEYLLEHTLRPRRFRPPARHRFEGRLRRVAVAVLVAYDGYDRESAERAVEEGTWTEDPVAAAFLGRPSKVPMRVRPLAFVTRTDPARLCAERSVSAVAAVIER